MLCSDLKRIDCKILKNDELLEIKNSEDCFIVFFNLVENHTLKINVDENAEAKLSFIADNKLDNFNIILNLGKNSGIDVYFADFSQNNVTLNSQINLNGEYANVRWRLASLTTKNDNKRLSVSVKHNAANTNAKVDNYGVCKDDSKLLFAGTSHIINGAVKSKTSQNAKIMVFDKISNAIAKPILKIDENDVEANHAAAVGKISDEHLFYLTSRGISIEEAKTLITLGYLKPIFNGFEEADINYLNSLIGGKF